MRALVYELHTSNLGPGTLAIREIDILAADRPARTLAVLRDGGLDAVISNVAMLPARSRRLDPGARLIAYLWVQVPDSEPIPRALRHRIVFDVVDMMLARRDGSSEEAIDNIIVPVAHDPAVRIRAPLGEGTWLAGGGPSNTSAHRRSLNAIHAHGYIAERFAADWQMIGSNGNTYHDDDHRNENYWGFGQPVYSVGAGEVVAVVDSIAENTPHSPLPPIGLWNIAGNYVTVRIAPDRYATYAHLKHGSVRVRVRERVSEGTVLGLLATPGSRRPRIFIFRLRTAPQC